MSLTEAGSPPSIHLDLDEGAWVVVAPTPSAQAHSGLLFDLVNHLCRHNLLSVVREARVDGRRGVLVKPRSKDVLVSFENFLREALADICRCSPELILSRLPRQREALATA